MRVPILFLLNNSKSYGFRPNFSDMLKLAQGTDDQILKSIRTTVWIQEFF